MGAQISQDGTTVTLGRMEYDDLMQQLAHLYTYVEVIRKLRTYFVAGINGVEHGMSDAEIFELNLFLEHFTRDFF